MPSWSLATDRQVSKTTLVRQLSEALHQNILYLTSAGPKNSRRFERRTHVQDLLTLDQIKKPAPLVKLLQAPVDSLLPKNGRIIVIPDGILTYIPFEALLSEQPSGIFKTGRYKYWVLDHEISYCYSATLLREMRKRNTE